MNSLELAQSLAWLAAGQSKQRFDDILKQYPNRGYDVSATQLVVFCVIAVVIGVVLWRVARLVAMRDGRSYFSTNHLFRQLCQLHDLDWPSRRLLRRFARARHLKNPAQLFVEPAWFDAVEVPAPLRPFQPQLDQIKQRLFD